MTKFVRLSRLPIPEPTMHLIDIGANLTHESFRRDFDAVLDRARKAGVERMIVTGASREGSEHALALAREHPEMLYATAGVHPHHAGDYGAETDALLRTLAREPEVVAVGETGLDYFRDLSPRPAQRAAFEKQLAIAAELGMPLFLHQRDAHDDFFALLKSARDRVLRRWCIASPTTVARCSITSTSTAMSVSPAGSATSAAARICANWCDRFPRTGCCWRRTHRTCCRATSGPSRRIAAMSRCTWHISARPWRGNAAKRRKPSPNKPARTPGRFSGSNDRREKPAIPPPNPGGRVGTRPTRVPRGSRASIAPAARVRVRATPPPVLPRPTRRRHRRWPSGISARPTTRSGTPAVAADSTRRASRRQAT